MAAKYFLKEFLDFGTKISGNCALYRRKNIRSQEKSLVPVKRPEKQGKCKNIHYEEVVDTGGRRSGWITGGGAVGKPRRSGEWIDQSSGSL